MIKEEIRISTPFIKLDQFLKFAGIAQTGGHSKEIIAQGAVSVNGEVCLQRGKKIYPEDIVEIDDYSFTVLSQSQE